VIRPHQHSIIIVRTAKQLRVLDNCAHRSTAAKRPCSPHLYSTYCTSAPNTAANPIPGMLATLSTDAAPLDVVEEPLPVEVPLPLPPDDPSLVVGFDALDLHVYSPRMTSFFRSFSKLEHEKSPVLCMLKPPLTNLRDGRETLYHISHERVKVRVQPLTGRKNR
jgi:hypothetical protein